MRRCGDVRSGNGTWHMMDAVIEGEDERGWKPNCDGQ